MTKDEIIRLAQESGIPVFWLEGVGHLRSEQLVRFAELVAAAEREACLGAVESERLVDPTGSTDDAAYNAAVKHCADAIRARSNKVE